MILGKSACLIYLYSNKKAKRSMFRVQRSTLNVSRILFFPDVELLCAWCAGAFAITTLNGTSNAGVAAVHSRDIAALFTASCQNFGRKHVHHFHVWFQINLFHLYTMVILFLSNSEMPHRCISDISTLITLIIRQCFVLNRFAKIAIFGGKVTANK